MKKFSFDIHYDMVIQDVEVMAETLEEAQQLAYEQAAKLPLESMECVNKDACLNDTQELTAREWHTKQAQAIIDYVHLFIDEPAPYTDDKEERKRNAKELAGMAYGGSGINWLEGMDVCNEDWQRTMFQQISDFEGINKYGVCDRYARLYARKQFAIRYKRVAKSPYSRDVQGRNKEDRKQAVVDGLRVLCDRMEQYVMHNDDPDSRYWEPQMVVRYQVDAANPDPKDYWNLFVYCAGPNDEDGEGCYCLTGAWQHVYTDRKGNEQIDDFETLEWHDSRSLIRELFYCPRYDDDPNQKCLTNVWVD